MSYIPFSSDEQKEMLQSIEVDSLDQLFSDIPGEIKLNRLLKIAPPLSELELINYFNELGNKNESAHKPCFIGAGSYDHYIPSVINHLIMRGEFFTAYTPYQPEASQGTLQYIFEFQSMICELTGMAAANASMYDGASAMAEAALMSCRSTGRDKVLISQTVNPQYREVVKTYLNAANLILEEIPQSHGITCAESMKKMMDSSIAGVIVQQPNFFGVIENYDTFSTTIQNNQSLFIMATNPISLGRLKTPSEYNADIVVMEGQPLGNALSFGGPYLGILACRENHIRKMPGRLVGMAEDHNGNKGFVLTLQAREQHIRRQKATSNICSNQSLNALCAVLYLSLLGKQGFVDLWNLNYQKAHYMASEIDKLENYSLAFTDKPFFNEFLVKTTKPVEKVRLALENAGLLAGYSPATDYQEYENCLLFCVTEKRTKNEIDLLVKTLEQV